MIRFKKLLIESIDFDPTVESAEKFADILTKAYYNGWLREKEEYGEKYYDVNDINYLIDGLDHDMRTGWQNGFPDFIYNAIEKGNVTNELVDLQPEDCSSYQHGCYYNALDFILRNEREDVSLAYGFFIHSLFEYLTNEKSTVEGYSLDFDVTLHSFIVTDDKKVFDPTLPHHEIANDDYYAWETVSESVYQKFDHEFNDENYDASEFADYIRNEVEKHKGVMNLKTRIKNFHEKTVNEN